jgi:hypothetical protein
MRIGTPTQTTSRLTPSSTIVRRYVKVTIPSGKEARR